MAAEDFLSFERQQVAIEHCRRLHEHFRQRQHRNLHRKAACLPDAPLHLLHPLGKVGVALVEVVPGVEDGDDRSALGVFGRIAHLPQPAAVPKATEIIRREPPLRPQVTHGKPVRSGGCHEWLLCRQFRENGRDCTLATVYLKERRRR